MRIITDLVRTGRACETCVARVTFSIAWGCFGLGNLLLAKRFGAGPAIAFALGATTLVAGAIIGVRLDLLPTSKPGRKRLVRVYLMVVLAEAGLLAGLRCLRPA